MKKILEKLDQYFEPTLIVLLLVSMTIVIFVQVVFRLFDISWPVAEEIARFMFVWAMYLSISYAIRDMRHIRISFFIDKLNQDLHQLANNCADLVFLIYSVLVVMVGYTVVHRSLELGQIAPATEWPVAVIYCSVVVGSLLNVWRLCNRILERKYAIDDQRSLTKERC